MPRSSRPSGGPRQKSRGAAEATAALAFLRAVEHLRGPIISRNVVSIRAGHKSSSEFAAIVTAVLSIIVKDVGKIGVRRISSPMTTDCRIRKFWTSRLVLGRRVSRTCLLVLLRVFARGLRLEIPVRLSVCDSRVMFVCESLRNTDLAICAGAADFLETSGRGNLRHAALSPFQISLHLLCILISFGQSGSGFRNALLGECLQILKLTVLCIQQSRSAQLSIPISSIPN